MIVSTSSFRKPVNPTAFSTSLQGVNLVRLILLLVMLATPVLLIFLPSQGEANYFLSAQVGDHSYSLPAYCESVTSNLTKCTSIGTLPLSSKDSESLGHSVKGLATPFHSLEKSLECHGQLNTFYCGRSLTQLSSITNH